MNLLGVEWQFHVLLNDYSFFFKLFIFSTKFIFSRFDFVGLQFLYVVMRWISQLILSRGPSWLTEVLHSAGFKSSKKFSLKSSSLPQIVSPVSSNKSSNTPASKCICVYTCDCLCLYYIYTCFSVGTGLMLVHKFA